MMTAGRFAVIQSAKPSRRQRRDWSLTRPVARGRCQSASAASRARSSSGLRPGDGYHRKLITAVEVHGIDAILGTLERLGKAGVKRGDTKGFVFGAIDALNEPSRPKLRAVEAAANHGRAVERTKIRAHELGAHADEPNPGCPRCAA